MTVWFRYPPGATPLAPDEVAGLIPGHISTQGELDAWEQQNILEAVRWSGRMRRDILTEEFLRKLHGRMFGETWRWAGKFRQSDKNIGVAWYQVATELRILLDDVQHQIAHQSYHPDEVAVRLHHRLVSIHPFPNGNGRHARLAADLLIQRLGQASFSWGISDAQDPSRLRHRYISALQAADRRDLAPLLNFARS